MIQNLSRRAADKEIQGGNGKKLYTYVQQESSPLLHQGLRGFVKNVSPVKKPAVPEGAETTGDNLFGRKTARQR